MTNPIVIASQFDFDLTKTWSKLSEDERANAKRAMSAMGGKSTNGVAGYFFNLRNQYLKEQYK